MKNITPLEAANILKEDKGAILVDVRTYGEVAEESIPGAKHIPLDELSSRLDEIENFSTLLFSCRSGGRSAVAASIAESAKLPGVMNVTGGIMAWMKEGLPVVRGNDLSAGFAHKKSIIIGSIFAAMLVIGTMVITNPASVSPALLASSTPQVHEFGSLPPAQFAQAITNATAHVLDVRTSQEYATGHIGSATNIDFYDMTFRDKLNTLNRDGEYYVYCRSGHRSGSTLTLMQELGFTRVHDLSGGIVNWESEGRPVSL